MAELQPPYPRFPIAERKQDELTKEWIYPITTPWGIFVRNLREDLDNAQIVQEAFVVPTSSASIGTTTILTPGQDGYYSFAYYAAITTPATTGAATSSLTVILSWTDTGIVKSKTFTAITGNTTATTGSETYPRFYVDGGAPITYSTTYASDTAGQMVYKLSGAVASVASS